MFVLQQFSFCSWKSNLGVRFPRRFGGRKGVWQVTEKSFRELSPEVQRWLMKDEYVRKAFLCALLLELKKLQQATEGRTRDICWTRKTAKMSRAKPLALFISTLDFFDVLRKQNGAAHQEGLFRRRRQEWHRIHEEKHTNGGNWNQNRREKRSQSPPAETERPDLHKQTYGYIF